MSDLRELGFIDDAHLEILEEMGVGTVEEFMAQAAKQTSREELAEITEISEKMLLRWAHLCEILDVEEVPKALIHILEESGVKEIKDLKNQNTKHLHDRLVELNEIKGVVPEIPGRDDIQIWIDKARQRDSTVE